MSDAAAAVPVYLQRGPSSGLAGVVRRLWYLSAPARGTTERILPIPYVHAIVNLGDPYEVLAHGTTRVGERFTGAFVSGLQSTYLVNHNPAHLHHVGAELEPFAWSAFGMEPFADEVRPGATVLPVLDGVRASQAGTRDAAAALNTLDAVLCEALTGSEAQPVIVAIAHAIAADPDQSMAHVAAQVGVSASSLAHVFRRSTGTTPKVHADVHRFHRFISELALPGSLPTWTEMVARSSYYDQPHFNRAFMRFAGTTPRTYLAALGDDGRAEPFFLATEGA